MRGFTLVELLVVTAVIIMLGTFAVPRAYAAINSSRETQVKKDLQAIQGALERHYLDFGYYPNKLNDLVVRGYLKAAGTFESPVGKRTGSKHWYFYAVDDNRNDASRGHLARAYVLGDPGKNPGPEAHLYHGGALPKGRNPEHTARAWLVARPGTVLNLYADGDSGGPIDNNLPASLATYRTSCQGAALDCDLITN